MKLEQTNQQLVTLVVEQRQEMRNLRDEMKKANARSYADVVRAEPRGVTLLVGNSLVRDVDVVRTAGGVSTNVRSKSGASFADIGDMIEEAANHDDLSSIVVVGGTKEAMDNVSIDDFKERTQLLISRATTVAEVVTVGSVLPWRDHDPQRLTQVNGSFGTRAPRCLSNLLTTTRTSLFATEQYTQQHTPTMGCTYRGVDRLLMNLALPKQKENKT